MVIQINAVSIYLDLPLFGSILGWLQDATLLWVVAQITGIKTKKSRFFAGGMVGGLFQFFLLINQASEGLVHRWVLSPLIFMFLIPLLMIQITFGLKSWRKTLRIIGYFYLIAFLLSGLHWGIDSINQRFFHYEITLAWRFWLHLALLFTIGELGWGVIHRKLWDQVCLYSIEIKWDQQSVVLTALLDTGNRLVDPLTKVPVVIVELNEIRRLIPKAILETIDQLQQGRFDYDWDLPGTWGERFRLLPFNSLGKDNGLLVGFRPDQLVVKYEQEEVVNQNVIVGFYQQKLSAEGNFCALIPPTVLNK